MELFLIYYLVRNVSFLKLYDTTWVLKFKYTHESNDVLLNEELNPQLLFDSVSIFEINF